MLRSAISAFTRVFDALCLAAWCAAGPGSMAVDGSRLCGAARRALHRVRDTRSLLLEERHGIGNAGAGGAVAVGLVVAIGEAE
jgi:hypothetical protein